jgi:hypothetical protein
MSWRTSGADRSKSRAPARALIAGRAHDHARLGPHRFGGVRPGTKFLHLETQAMLGERINAWRLCWLGGWDRGRLFYLVMVERASRAVAKSSRYREWLMPHNLTQYSPFSGRALNRRFPLIRARNSI